MKTGSERLFLLACAANLRKKAPRPPFPDRNSPRYSDSVNAADIPLFPLNTVLFPGGLLPLRIFEPRYLDMVEIGRAHV